MKGNLKDLMTNLNSGAALSEDDKKALSEAILTFKKTF